MLFHMIMVIRNLTLEKVPMFNGDPEEFSWWKTNFYSYVMGLDEELWDILEEGVGDLVLDQETYSCSEETLQETSQDQRITCSCYTSCKVYENE